MGSINWIHAMLYIVAVGQKRAEIVRIRSTLEAYNATFYTCIVFTSADQLATLQYLAPYAGCAIGEWFWDKRRLSCTYSI